jgi:hypothetical protein
MSGASRGVSAASPGCPAVGRLRYGWRRAFCLRRAAWSRDEWCNRDRSAARPRGREWQSSATTAGGGTGRLVLRTRVACLDRARRARRRPGRTRPIRIESPDRDGAAGPTRAAEAAGGVARRSRSRGAGCRGGSRARESDAASRAYAVRSRRDEDGRPHRQNADRADCDARACRVRPRPRRIGDRAVDDGRGEGRRCEEERQARCSAREGEGGPVAAVHGEKCGGAGSGSTVDAAAYRDGSTGSGEAKGRYDPDSAHDDDLDPAHGSQRAYAGQDAVWKEQEHADGAHDVNDERTGCG